MLTGKAYFIREAWKMSQMQVANADYRKIVIMDFMDTM